MRESDDFRRLLAQAKRHDHAGDYVRAFFFLGNARRKAKNEDTRHKYKIGIVDHRHALLEAKYGDEDDARRMFKRAGREIKSDAPIERASWLRDFGKFEFTKGNAIRARQMINEALALLENADKSLDELETHIIITNGFLAQLDVEVDRQRGLRTLRSVASQLRGQKPEYELEPITCLIEKLPPHPERQMYILRAIYLCLLIGNRVSAAEYTALLGGKPLRGIYRYIF